MWSGQSSRPINYGLAPEMGMVGLRDVFVVAPASFHHNNHHHHHHHHGHGHSHSHNLNHDPNLISDHSLNGSNPATALGVGVGVGVIPLLATTPCLGPPPLDESSAEANALGAAAARSRGSGIQLWQSQNQQATVSAVQPQLHQHLFKKPSLFEHGNSGGAGGNLVIQSGGSGGGGGGIVGSGSTSSSTTTCQDCGNQAKKDCSHRRCRTCCKSRGFECATHVKSTWVPAARRRERQLMTVQGGGTGPGSSGSTSGAKKPRLITSQTTSHTSTSNTTPPRSFDTSSSHQDASFKESLPGLVRETAVFKCVRVTAVEDGEDEYAYQAMVKIGGHVFKGFLYDQGVETREAFPNLSELHLGGGGSGGGGGGGRNGASSSSPIIDPSDVYGASTGGLLGGGSSYGNPIN